jgi:hypothetical protein
LDRAKWVLARRAPQITTSGVFGKVAAHSENLLSGPKIFRLSSGPNNSNAIKTAKQLESRHEQLLSSLKCNNALSARHSWSSVYRLFPSNYENNFISSPSFFHRTGIKMQDKSDFISLLNNFPQLGVLFCDGQDRPTLLHGIRISSNSNLFQGFIGNRIHSSPVEFEMNNILFAAKKPSRQEDISTHDHTIPVDNATESDMDSSPLEKSRVKPTTNPGGTNTPGGCYIVHPYIVPFLLDLPQPLSSGEMRQTFLDIESQLCSQGASTAFAHITNWINHSGMKFSSSQTSFKSKMTASSRKC